MNMDKTILESLPKPQVVQSDYPQKLANFSVTFLLQIINAISDPIFIKDRQHRWVLFNDAFCGLMGRDREELIGKSDYDFFSKAEAEELWQKDELIFTSGVYREQEEYLTNAFGITNLIAAKKSVFTDETGNQFLVGVIRDTSERKITEEALRKSEAKLQKISANVLGMLYHFVMHPDGSFTMPYVSSGCYELYGLKPEAIQADPTLIIMLCHPEEREAFHQSIVVSAQTLGPWIWEGRIILPSGEIKWLRGESRPEQQGNGSIAWYGLLVDVTRRKQAEEALAMAYAQMEKSVQERTNQLAASQQKLELLIQNVPLAIIEWNSNFEIQLWNPAAEKIFGYSQSEVLGHNFSFLIPESARENVNQVLEALLTQSGGNWNTNENITKDGQTIICEWYNTQLVAEKGEVISVASMALDITARKKAEKEQANLVTILEATSDFVAISNPEGYYIYMNHAGRRMMGIGDDDDVTKTHFMKTIPDNMASFVEREMSKLFDEGIWRGETALKRLDGTEIPVSQVVMIHKSETGEIELISSIARDITVSKQAEAELKSTLVELQQTQMQLVQTEKMSSLGQLVAGVAHEINNPTSFIYGNLNHAHGFTQDLLTLVQLYQKYYPQPAAEIQTFTEEIDLDFVVQDLPKLLQSMKSGAQRIREIVLGLRTFSRIDEADMKEVNIHEGIESTLMILEHRLKKTPERPAIEIIKEYGNLPLVECYAGQLNQVFINILTNGIDALEEAVVFSDSSSSSKSELVDKPQITISTKIVEENKVQICITDNGLGISEKIKQRIFDPFFTTKPVGKGTGMGLSISYQIITERHGGSLQCFSQTPQGSSFVITIPLCQRKMNLVALS